MEQRKKFSQKAQEDFLLVNSAKEGDHTAFNKLYSRYQKPVYHMILKMVKDPCEAEDRTSEAFAKAFDKIQKFNPDYTFSTWLFRIATNNAIDWIRKKKLETQSLNSTYTDDNGENVGLDVKDDGMDPEHIAIKQQRAEIVRKLVTRLPDKYQELVRLRYFKELSYAEISDQLNAPLGTVKAQLHRARELLMDLLKHRKSGI